MKAVPFLTLLGLAVTDGMAAQTPTSEWSSDWPAGSSVADVGQRLADNSLPRKSRHETLPARAHLGLIYPEACAWYGAFTVTQLTDNRDLTTRLIAKFSPFFTEAGITSAQDDRTSRFDFCR